MIDMKANQIAGSESVAKKLRREKRLTFDQPLKSDVVTDSEEE